MCGAVEFCRSDSRIKAFPIELRGAFLIALIAIVVLGGCKSYEPDVLRVGVLPGPAEEILHAIEPAMAQQGLHLKIVRFSDDAQPDAALASHDLDANLDQSAVFLDQFNRERQTHLVAVERVYLPVMAMYPGRTKSLEALADGARIGLPGGPVDHGRALLLLGRAGLLQVAHDAGARGMQIMDNPKHLKLVDLEDGQLAGSLKELDGAVIDAKAAMDAGLNPRTGSLVAETSDSPYAEVLAVNAEAQADAHIRILAAALASVEAKLFIRQHYGGAVVPVE
jgi:D-methionine transport system substrate-binding protein